MKSKVKILIAAVIAGVLTGMYSVIDKNNAIYDPEVDSSDYAAVVLDDRDVLKQTFLSREDALDGIGLKITASASTEGVSAKFRILDAEASVLAEGEAALDDLKNGRFFRFDFERIEGCRGKAYTLELKLEGCDEMTGVTVYEVSPPREGTELVIRNEKAPATLALRTITHRFDLETFVVTLLLILYVVLFMRWLAKLFRS